MASSRGVIQGTQNQGVDEAVSYSITTTPWGSNPTLPTLKVVELVNYEWIDRTAVVVPIGTPVVTGDVISLPLIRNLTEGHTYRALVGFTVDGNVLSAYFDILAER